MRRLIPSLAVLALCGGPALAQDEFARAPAALPPAPAASAAKAKPAKPVSAAPPIQTKVSATQAVTYLTRYVCMPGFFGEAGPEVLAPYHQMQSSDPAAAGGHPGEKAWFLNSSTKVYVLQFASGACGISLGNGSGGDYKTAVLDALKFAPAKFSEGATKADDVDHLTTTTYCTDGDKPVVARIALPTVNFHPPHKLELALSAPTTGRPADCSTS